MTVHYRVAPVGEVRDVDESKRQVLVTIPHERLDTYRTDFSREAFRDSFAQRLPKMAWMHQATEPIGHATRADVTDKANELVAQFSDFDACPRARQAFTQIRDKDITDFSFGFANAEGAPHPTEKGAIRFRKATMREISPVMTGSIPGAVALGVRAVAEASGIADLVRAGEVTAEDAAAVLRAAGEATATAEIIEHPERERIVLSDLRGMTISIADDGTVTSTGGPAGGSTPADTGGDTDIDELVAAADACLDEAAGIIHNNDTTTWPAAAAQVAALVLAGQDLVGQVMDAAGIDDPDDDDPQAAVTAPARSADIPDEGVRVAEFKKGDKVTAKGKNGTVDSVMPNGVLLVDFGDGKTVMVAAKDAKAAAATRDDEPSDDDVRAARDVLDRALYR